MAETAAPWPSPRPARQYLFLSLEDMGNGFEGAKLRVQPAAAPVDHQEDLWRGLVKDDLQTVGTNHCPFDFVAQKYLGTVTSARPRTASPASRSAWT